MKGRGREGRLKGRGGRVKGGGVVGKDKKTPLNVLIYFKSENGSSMDRF